jgi:hypothetical protein
MNRKHDTSCGFSLAIGVVVSAFGFAFGCTSQNPSNENMTPVSAEQENEPMSNAKIVGIYPIEFTDEWFQKYWISVGEEEGSYDDMSEEERAEEDAYYADLHRRTMEGLHVIEIEANRPITRSEVDLFTQDAEKGMMSQVPYLEVWLDDAGRPIESDWRRPQETNRVAFYLHFVELDKPLYGPWGKIELPAPSELPERLHKFLDYEHP